MKNFVIIIFICIILGSVGWHYRANIIFEIYPLILEARGPGEKSELSVKEINGDEIMEVKNALVPNDEQMKGFMEGDIDTPIYMVNLLKFKDKAEYEDGRETNLTGEEAYSIYGLEVQEHLKKVDAELIFSGKVERLMLGEVGELWDVIAIAKYPSRKAMMEMIMDADYQESEKHRAAGLKGQLNIETKTGEFDW
jgi:uncharacterized protein (DUF1330 family)